MKINRRGFIALGALVAHQSFGRNSIFSANTSQVSLSNKLEELLCLKKCFLSSSLRTVFNERFESFEKLGFKNSIKGCLMNSERNYAICPVELVVEQKIVNQALLLFSKENDWKYIGTLNNYESKLYLQLVENLAMKEFLQMKPNSLLPIMREVDGVKNAFCSTHYSLCFKVLIEPQGTRGELTYNLKNEVGGTLTQQFS